MATGKSHHTTETLVLPEINFLDARLTYRREHATVKREAIARAMGLKTGVPTRIVDATAGMGQDSFILAALGCEVILLERSELLNQKLQQAMSNGKNHPAIASILARMALIHADAIQWLASPAAHQRQPDIIYLDPMFPETRKKSALSQKTMQSLQQWVGDDADADKLLPPALACATKRVVVKRPRLAANLAGKTPDFKIIGKSSRFDVYLLCLAG